MARSYNDLGVEFKYLIVNDTDRKFGLYINTVGVQAIRPNSPYPIKDHPSGYLFNAKKGRILREYQLLYITKGKGTFASDGTPERNIGKGNGSVEISWGLFFILVKYCLLRIMKNDYLNMLASLVLPAQILDYFLISGVEQTSQEIHISLDEKMNPKLSNDEHFESKGFMEAVNVTDFPIRDHKVILKIRRRRWTDLRTGKSFSIPIDLDVVAKGTRYSKEFGAFLKETYGDIPSDLPYA
mgnify:CR=1 FL=1